MRNQRTHARPIKMSKHVASERQKQNFTATPDNEFRDMYESTKVSNALFVNVAKNIELIAPRFIWFIKLIFFFFFFIKLIQVYLILLNKFDLFDLLN